MIKWPKTKLSSLCNRIGDGLHGTPQYKTNGGVHFINGNNLKDGKIVINIETKKVSNDEAKKHYIPLNKYTLLIGINGSIGNMAFYNGENVLLGKSSAYLNFKSDINKFFYYYFQLPTIQKYFYNVATGSTIKNLSLKSLQDFEVPLPPEFEYKKIASVLSALDDKIKLNNRINDNLEQTAKAIYNYWFVQFDFPDSDGKPYQSSGSKMVYNRQLKREIPEGWEVKSFGHYCKSKGGFAFKSNWWTERGIPVIKIKDIQEDYTINLKDVSFVSEDKAKIAEKFIAKPGNVVIAMTGATVGKFAIVPFTPKELLVNQRVGLFDLGDYPFEKLPFLINSLNQDYFREMVFTLASGAAQPNISNDQINDIQLVIPTDNILSLFNNKLKEVYIKIMHNQKQNQELAALRDWLLPMLMNGQVTIKDSQENEKPALEAQL